MEHATAHHVAARYAYACRKTYEIDLSRDTFCFHVTTTAGAGELARTFNCDGFGVLTSPPLLLFSLTALLSSFIFVSLEPVVSLLTSPLKSIVARFGARHVGTVQLTPVKLLT